MDGRVSGRCHYCTVGVRELVKKFEGVRYVLFDEKYSSRIPV